MNHKKQAYFKVLGIPPTNDKSVIKSAYRKKALRYHPDRNQLQSAHEKFIQLTEAYEYLIELPHSKVKTSAHSEQKTSEDVFAKRMRDARERYRDAQQKEKEANLKYYQKITTGIRGRAFFVYSTVVLLIAIVWFFDCCVLNPKVFHFITDKYTVKYNQICFSIKNTEYCFDSAEISVANSTISGDAFFTTVFNDLKYVDFSNMVKNQSMTLPSIGFVYLFLFFVILFMIPILTYVLKKPTVLFTFFHLFSITIVAAALLIRLASLLF